MENQNPLEMQNPDLNPYQPPHLAPRAHCAFCGAVQANNAVSCSSCGAQSEHALEPNAPVYDDSCQTTPYKESVNKVIDHRSETIKGRLEPDHSKPLDKRKLLYSVIIIILALVVIGLLGSQ